MMPVTPITVPQNEQQNVIWFLALQNVSDNEIHTRICEMCGAQNVITKLAVNCWVQGFMVVQMSTSEEHQNGRP